MSFKIVRAGPSDGFAVDAIMRTDAKSVLVHPGSWPDLDLELCLSTLIAKDSSGRDAGMVMVTDRLDGFDLDSAIATIQSIADGLISVGNTGILKAFAVHSAYEQQRSAVTDALLRAVFAALPDFDHLICLQPEGSTHGSPFLNRNFINVPSLPGVWVCPRQNILPTMFVRNARVEDFDDLIPVFDAQSEVVASGFGQYFLAEVIEARDKEHAALVGEGPSGHAVGLMAATSASNEVRLPLLDSSFDLSAFGHLVKPDSAVEALGARAAQLEARMQCDWYSVLAAHADELEGLFDSLPVVNDPVAGEVHRHDGVPILITPAGQAPPPPSREAAAEAIATGKTIDTNVIPDDVEAVFVSDVVSLFDAKGDAWGFVGVAGVRLGSQMMVDLGLPSVATAPDSHAKRRTAVTRNALNTAVEDFAARRERMHMRQRVAGWYTYVKPTVAEEGAHSGSGTGEDSARPGSGALQRPASGKLAPASSAPSYSGPPPGRKLVTEEFDKLESARSTERKDTLRAAQQAVTAAQKEVDACSAADRAAHEAALKEKAEREAAERKAAGAKAGPKKPDAAASGSSLYKPPPVPKSAATAAAEAKLEAAQKAVLTAQASLASPLRVPLVALAAAINTRLIVDGIPTSSVPHTHIGHHSQQDMQNSQADLNSTGGPAAEFLLDAAVHLPEAKAQVVAELTPPGARAPHVDSSDASLASTPNPKLTKPVFQALLQMWEQRSLPAVTSRVFTVTSVSSSIHYAMRSYGSAESVPACTPGEEAIAAAASALLNLPRLHLPSFFTSAASAFAEQERLRAEEEIKRKEAEEKRRKKEEEEKKKELMAGKAPTSKEDKAKEGAKKAAEAPREDKNRLLDPASNPCGALLQHLKKHDKFAAGVILTGLPVHDAQACEELAHALNSAQLPIVLNLHASETIDADGHGRPTSARPGSAGVGGKPLVRLPSGRVSQDKSSVFAEERLMQGALQRRNSFAQLSDAARAFAVETGRQHAGRAAASGPAAPLTLLAGHSKSSPWSSTVGHVVHVDADEAHLVEESLRRQGKSHRGTGAVEPAVVAALLREHLLGIFLREGMLSTDPTAPAGESAGMSAKEAQQAYTEALLREDGSTSRASNAFAITLYCLDVTQESRSVDLLAAAFEAFPDREYCVLTQPHSAPDLPLLRRFVRVPSKPSTTLDAVLYVCHRDSLLAPALVTVRRATKADRPVIQNMTRSLPDAQQFMDAIVASEYRSHQPLSPVVDGHGVLVEPAARIASFAVEVEGTVVGCVILTNTGAEADAVRAAAISYDLDKHLSVQHYVQGDLSVSFARHSADGAAHAAPTAVGCLLHMVVAPTFLPASPFILRTALRLYGNKSAALYRQHSSALGAHIAAPLPPVVREHMCLVPPRRLPELNPADASAREKIRAERASEKAEHVGQMDCITLAAYTIAGRSRSELADPRSLDQGLYVFSTRSSVHRRTHINARVVLVGASDTALSAMATLLLQPTVQVNNLLVISPGGLPRPSDAFSHPAPFVPGREYSAFELSRLPLSSHITVVDDVVTAIHRKEKSVTLQGSTEAAAPTHAGFGHAAAMGGAPKLVTGGGPSINSKSHFMNPALGTRAKVRYDCLVLLPGLTEATWSKLHYPAPEAVPRGMHCLTHAEELAALAADVDALSAEIEGIQAAGQVPLASPVSEAAVDIAGEGIAQCTDVDVAVYGEGLEALTAINALLDRGIPGHHIVHLRPCRRAFEADAAGVAPAATSLGTAAGPTQSAAAGAYPPVAVDVLDDLLPVASSGPRSAPLSADGVFTSKAVASVLAAAGVRTILGAEVVAVGGSMATAVEAGIGLNMSSLGEEDDSGLGGASESLHAGSTGGGAGPHVQQGGVEGGSSLGGEDALPAASIPGLSIDVRLRRLPVPVVPGSEAEGIVQDAQPVQEATGFDDEPPPEAPPPPPQVETVTIPAALLLCAADRDVDPRFFKAVDDSGIVYDGRLVLSHTFNATDPAVFGGGSVAKFSRRYRTEVPLSKYESREVGQAVALSVLRYLTEGGEASAGSSSAPPTPELLPSFTRPKVTKAVLPGNLYYVRARLPLAVHGETGKEVVTFVAPQLERGLGMRYCRMSLSRYGTISELEYCGNDPVESSNLASLAGLHCAYLNGLERRVQHRQLPDLIDFLRQTWASALYHDRFKELVQVLRQALSPGGVAAGPSVGAGAADSSAHGAIATLLAKVMGQAEGRGEAPAAEGKEEPHAAGASTALSVDALVRQAQVEGVGVGGRDLPVQVKRTVEVALLDYLRANKQILPVYITPSVHSA